MADDGISGRDLFLFFVAIGSVGAAWILRRQWRRKGIGSLERTALIWGALGIAGSIYFQVGPSIMSGTVIEHSRRSPEEIAEFALRVSIAACFGALLIRHAAGIARFIFAGAAVAMCYIGATSYMGLWLLLAPVELLFGLPSTIYAVLHGGRQSTVAVAGSIYDALIPLYCMGACVSAGLAWAIPGSGRDKAESLIAKLVGRKFRPDKA